MGKTFKTLISTFIGVGILSGIVASTAAINKANEEQKWQRICDGTSITEQCSDEDGNRYSKYVFHEAEPEKTKEVYHAATPAKTHIVHHPTEYGTNGTRTKRECIKTTINYKGGTCALSRCADGEYSGSTGRGTCSYHGGVWYGGGPWYTYTTETYIIRQAWDETVIDVPAKEAWTETVVDSPAKPAWTEKVLAK